MADLTNSPVPPTDPFNADVYWRYASESDENLRLLGTFGIGVPQSALIPVPTTADVVLKALPRGPRGTYQHALAAEGPSTTVNIPGIGGAGPGASYYQTLRQNNGYSSPYWPSPTTPALPQEGAINFLQSFRLVDDPAHGETDLYTYGVPTGMLNLKTDFSASGQINVTTGSIAAGSLTTLVCAATLDLQPGCGIYIAGAGPSSGALITKVTAVSTDGKTYTLQDAATGAITSATVQADDTAAVQAWVNAKGDLSMPPGYYRLTSSIVLPTTSEGFSIIVHGSGWDVTTFAFQHGGDGFIPTSDLRIDSVCFLDLVIATGTIGDTGGTIDANSKGIGLRMTAPDYTGVYDQFVMNRCRIIGWGRFGIWSDNLEVSWIGECIFRENKSGHVAFVGPDTISPNKQPNANTLTNCTFDQAIGVNDSKRTVSGSMTSGSRTLTVSGTSLTANDRGRFVIVHGAATIGGDLYSFIDSVQSGSSCTLAHKAQATSSGTLEIFPTNVASILLNRANDTVIDGATIQGNFVGCSTSADINAIKMYNSANCRMVGIHEEDNAGWGGAAVRMENCISIGIDNWGGTSGDSALQNAHNSDFNLTSCHCVSVENSFFNDRPQFVIDSTSSETRIDDSFVVGYFNLWQQDNSWDKLRIGSGVRVYQSADPRTNQSCGNEYIYDSLFGRDLITNGRFLDGASPAGLEGWTTSNPTWWTRTATSDTRYGTYINVDSTSIADGGPQTLLHQAVAIPDSLPPGAFTLAFDWQIVNESGSSTATGRFTEIRLHPSTGLDEAMQWSVRGFPYVTGVWQTAQIKCWLGGPLASRTIDVQINATSGVNNVRMRFANFRLTAGKHSFGSYERAIHDFGGRMRVPLEFSAISSTTYPPPPTGSTYLTLANIGGVMNIGSPTGGAGGTPGYIPLASGTTGTAGANQTLSNLTPPTAINASLLFDTDAAYDVGSVSKRVHNLYVRGDLWNFAITATTSAPRVVGVIPTNIEGSTPGEAGQIAIFGGRDSLQSADGYRTQLASYWGIEIRGNREVNGGPTFVAGASSDPAVTILAERNVVPLRIDSTIALTGDLVQFWNNGGILPKARIAFDGTVYCAGIQATGTGGIATASGTSNVRLDPTTGKVQMTAAQLGSGTTPQCNIYPAVVTASEFGILKCDITNGGTVQIPTGIGAAANDTFLWNATEGRWKTGPSAGSSITGSGTQYFIPRVNPASPYTLVDSGLKDDGVNITCSRPHFFGSPNATVNFGDSSTGQLGAVYVVNGFFINPTGTTRSGPKTIGCIDAFTGTPGGDESGQFLFYYGRSKIQAGNQIRSIWQSYQAIEIRGNRQNTADAALTTGAAGDACLLVISERSTAVPLRVDSTLGLTADLAEFYNNATLKAQVNANGSFLGFSVNVTGVNQVSAFNNSASSQTSVRIDHASGGVWMTGAQKATTTYPQCNLTADVVTASEWGVLKATLTNLGAVQIPTGVGSAVNDVFLWSTTQGRWIVGAIPGGTGGGANTALSNLTATSINQSFVFNADGTYNIGDPTNRVGAIYLKNAFFVYTVGSTSSSPKAAGFLDPASGECTRLLISGNQSVAQGGNGHRTQFTGYYGLEFRGTRLNATAPSMTTTGAGATTDPGVSIINEQNVSILHLDSTTAITGSANLIEALNNGSSRWQLRGDGSVVEFGGHQFASRSINTTTVLTETDCLVICDAATAYTVTLPSAFTNGLVIYLIRETFSGSGTITIAVQSGDIIEGVTNGTLSMTTARQKLMLLAWNQRWYSFAV